MGYKRSIQHRDRLRPRDPGRVALIGVGVAVAFTVAVVVHPDLRFGYQRAPLRVAVETALGLVGAVVGYLALGRFRANRRLTDLLVLEALVVLALVNFGFAAIPGSLALSGTEELVTWATPVGRACAALLLAAAALLDRPSGPTPRRLVAAVVGAPAAVVVAVVVLRPRLLPPVPDVAAADASRPLFTTDPMVSVFPAVSALLFAVAATGFLLRSRATGDRFGGWLGAGCGVLAVANVHYALFPSLSPEWFYSGDLVRSFGYLLWVVGAGSEISSYWSGLAIAEERRRLARELHDGLAQELAFITAQTAALSRHEHGGGGRDEAWSEKMEDLRRAGQRGLDEARRAIAALTHDPDEPLAELVTQAAEDVALRMGLAVRLDIGDAPPPLEHGPREAIVRIVREAVTNAARHSGAGEVHIELAGGDEVLLRVSDDGAGFDPVRCGAGFGLTSMRERAAAIGAQLDIRSDPGRGTTVELRCR